MIRHFEVIQFHDYLKKWAELKIVGRMKGSLAQFSAVNTKNFLENGHGFSSPPG
jgi:hypothetical protein